MQENRIGYPKLNSFEKNKNWSLFDAVVGKINVVYTTIDKRKLSINTVDSWRAVT